MSAPAIAGFACDLGWRVAVAWSVGVVLAGLLRRRAAAWRHAVWLGVLAVPLVPPLLAGGRLRPAWCERVFAASDLNDRGDAIDGAVDAFGPMLVAAGDSGQRALPMAAARSAARRTESSRPFWRFDSRRAVAVATGLVALWFAGIVVGAALAWRRVRRRRAVLAASAAPSAALVERLRELATRLEVAPPPLRLSSEFATPGLVGVVRPMLVLPATLLDGRGALLDPILVHELLHLRRRDPWLAAGAAALRVLLWWHPCIRHAAARLARERELCVDEAVLHEGRVPAMAYAKSLIEVAERAVAPATLRPAVALSSSARRLRERIERVVAAAAQDERGGVALGARHRAVARISTAALTLAIAACGAASSTQPADTGASGAVPPENEAAPSATRAGSHEVEKRVAAALGNPPRVMLLDLPGQPLERGGCSRLILVTTDGQVAATENVDLPGGGEPLPVPRALSLDSDEGAHRIEIHLGAGSFQGEAGVVVQAIDAVKQFTRQRVADPNELVAGVRAALAGCPAESRSITAYPRVGAEFHEIAFALAPVLAAFAGESVSFAGTPAALGAGPQIEAALAQMTLPPVDQGGDLVLAVDPCAPWASCAQVMQWLAARGHGRIALLAQHDGQLVKVPLYLPRDADRSEGAEAKERDGEAPGTAAAAPRRAPADLAELLACLRDEAVEVASVAAGGIGLERGGARLLVVIRADGTIATPLPLALPDDGHGFKQPPPMRLRTDGGADGAKTIEVAIGPGPTPETCSARVDGVRQESPAALPLTLRAALGGADFTPSVTLYPFGKSRIGPLVPWLAELQTALPELPVTYAGVPSDMNAGQQIEATLAQLDPAMPGGGEVLIAADPAAPSSSLGQVMQEFGARKAGRLALVARRGDEWVKFSLYLRPVAGAGE